MVIHEWVWSTIMCISVQYLETVRPLMDDASYQEMEGLVHDFQVGTNITNMLLGT